MDTGIDTGQMAVKVIETFPFRPELVESITTVLASHGITLEHNEERCMLHFPEGTYKCELLPRGHETRYEVRLPDGLHLYETCAHEEGTLSLIRLNLDDFPQQVRAWLLQDQNASGGDAEGTSTDPIR